MLHKTTYTIKKNLIIETLKGNYFEKHFGTTDSGLSLAV